jgi:hypothetical protein
VDDLGQRGRRQCPRVLGLRDERDVAALLVGRLAREVGERAAAGAVGGVARRGDALRAAAVLLVALQRKKAEDTRPPRDLDRAAVVFTTGWLAVSSMRPTSGE